MRPDHRSGGSGAQKRTNPTRGMVMSRLRPRALRAVGSSEALSPSRSCGGRKTRNLQDRPGVEGVFPVLRPRGRLPDGQRGMLEGHEALPNRFLLSMDPDRICLEGGRLRTGKLGLQAIPERTAFPVARRAMHASGADATWSPVPALSEPGPRRTGGVLISNERDYGLPPRAHGSKDSSYDEWVMP